MTNVEDEKKQTWYEKYKYLIIIVILILLIVAGYFTYNKYYKKSRYSTPQNPPTMGPL